MLFKRNKLKNVVIAYDKTTKQVLFFQQEKSGGYSRLGRKISLGRGGNIELADSLQFIFFLGLLSDISGMKSREFICEYTFAYVFYQDPIMDWV